MVVKVTEYTGTLNCKNCVIVPYSSHSSSSHSNIHCEKHKKPNTSNCGSQTISTSLFHRRDENKSEQLWHKQFSRWWSWNWQRKRASLLKKLSKKHYPKDNLINKNPLMKNKSVECNLIINDELNTKENEIKNIIYRNSNHNGRLHQINFDYDYDYEQLIPGFVKNTIKCDKNKGKKNKQKERVYEGWMREVYSSDDESSNKNRMHYLSLRLSKFNSELFIENSDKSNQKNNDTQTNIKKVTEYKSPITGKIYNLNLSKCNTYDVKPEEINYLNSKCCADKDFLAKPQFECTTQYYKIKNEHFDLLNSICKIVNKRSEIKTINTVFNEDISASTSCIVEIGSSSKNTNLTLYSNTDPANFMPNISKSLPIFMEQNSQDLFNYNRNSEIIDTSFFDLTKSEGSYDINYLHNNLDVFKSSITETSFIWDYLQKK